MEFLLNRLRFPLGHPLESRDDPEQKRPFPVSGSVLTRSFPGGNNRPIRRPVVHAGILGMRRYPRLTL